LDYFKNGYFASRFFKKTCILQSQTNQTGCMDFKQIQELIKIVNRSTIGELSIEEGDFKITIKQKEEPVPVYHSAPAQTYTPPPAQLTAPTQQLASPGNSNSPGSQETTPKQTDNLVTIKSPMIGTFYRSSGPDKPSFVNIGDEVSVGKTVCIIEAMKLFNEIESEVKGTIVKVLVEDASPVEYDQPLFLVEP
jgi:acetyl-CoA carboxylase biotin carboxyl carrier protein